MNRPTIHEELARAREELALQAMRLTALRLRRSLLKYSPDQPRVPAGNPDGGQWTDGGGGAGSGAGLSEVSGRDEAPPRTIEHTTGDPAVRSRTSIHADGLRISSRIAGGGALAGGKERYTVVAQNGDAATFETIGRTQTVYGPDGKAVLRNEWTSQGPMPLIPRPTIDLSIPAGLKLLYLGLRLQQDMLSRQMEEAITPVLAFRSRLYEAGGLRNDPKAIELGFVGELSREETERACPKLPDVQAMADEARMWAGPMRPEESPATYGTRVHTRLKYTVNLRDDPNLKAEVARFEGEPADVWQAGHVRFDVLERTPADIVCIYDLKTGRRGFPPKRADDYAREAALAFPYSKTFIAIEIRNP
jgi:hypothetical protein